MSVDSVMIETGMPVCTYPSSPNDRGLLTFRKDRASDQWTLGNLSLRPSLTTELNCCRPVVRRGLNVMYFLTPPPEFDHENQTWRFLSF